MGYLEDNGIKPHSLLKIFQRKFEKPLDKPLKVWYN